MNKKYITLTLILLGTTQTYTMKGVRDTQYYEAQWMLGNTDPNAISDLLKSYNNKPTIPKSLRDAAAIYLGPKAAEFLIPKQKNTAQAKKTKKSKKINKKQYACNLA